MDTAKYFALAQTFAKLEPTDFSAQVSVTLITNFTDKIIEKLLIGLCLENNIYPKIYSVPYKQYDMLLADKTSDLYTRHSDITFVFFDATPLVHSRFTDAHDTHMVDVLESLKQYTSSRTTPVVIHTLPVPYNGPYGNLFSEESTFAAMKKFNDSLWELQKSSGVVTVCDTDRLLHRFGENKARDLRNHHAFDIPFSNEFSFSVVQEWLTYIIHCRGKIKKCIVVDLDNTLWGGVVGELGPSGISLGPDYPGVAFQNFQRALLRCFERGILLAINSKNNASDVDEVFENNPHMILKKHHFATIRANWDQKTDNLVSIAKELNIGVDSLVFIDDDPFQRELVRSTLPDVLVPEFSLPPEEYARTLFSLPIFTQFRITDEDKNKNQMYLEEREREQIKFTTTSLSDYIAKLGLEIKLRINPIEWIPRLAQLTLKTNQFNLTTTRYTEDQMKQFMNIGRVYAADVSDKFGNYGITIVSIIEYSKDQANLDSFLMSCRVMGRGIEKVFFQFICQDLANLGVTSLSARFIPTAKNAPAKEFLASMGMQEIGRDNEGGIRYNMSIQVGYPADESKSPITIILQ